MGFGDAVGPFVGLARDEFQLSNAVAAMVPFTGFIMFGLLSVPMGVLQDRRGKKFVLMMGLLVAFAGQMNASFGLTTFTRFLLTILLLGAGAAVSGPLAALGIRPRAVRERALRQLGPAGPADLSNAPYRLGLHAGHATAQDAAAKDDLYARAQALAARFEAEHGATACRQLTGADLRDPAQRQAASDSSIFTTLCPQLVRTAAGLVAETLVLPRAGA